jgi:CxxC-x17-CxxC domain-containing protein
MFGKKSYGGGARGGSKGGSRFGGGSKPWERGGRDGGAPEMHSATCDDCGQRCEVPFKPNGKKPVFCRACFGKSEGGEGGRFEGARPERPTGGAGDSFVRDQLKEINSKLDAIIRSLDV